MEYYKELFFTKKKHSYDLHTINFYAENQDDVVKYNNVPSKGFKMVKSGLLDPITGYIFHPENLRTFNEQIVQQNMLINSVCVTPVIFEYIKDGSFNVHIYNSVKDNLMEVSISNKVCLSESEPGTILRSVEDESYYIYLGMVGQYYVSERGKGAVKKKHLVLKTDRVNDADDTTEMIVHHLSYVDFTKDKIKNYIKVKDIAPNNLKIKYYYYGSDIIHLGKYITNNKFDVYDFQRDYPALLLSKTVKILFSKDDISMTQNKVKLQYEYIGETGLDMTFEVDYNSFDSKNRCFYNASVKTNLVATNPMCYVDFEKHNYVVEVGSDKYLISARRLPELECFSCHFNNGTNLFKNFNNSSVFLFKMDNSSVTNNRGQYYQKSNDKAKSFDWSETAKIYKVEYILNDKYSYNIFTNPFEEIESVDELTVNDREVFDYIRANNGLAITIMGEDNGGPV